MSDSVQFTESETQAPEDLQYLEQVYSSPPRLAQECKSYKWKIQLIDHDNNIEDQMLTTKDVWKLQDRKVIVHFDEDSGQPDEDSGGLLGSWLGQLSTDVNLLPINYSDWRLFSSHKKAKAWEVIQNKFWFDDPETRKDYVIGVLGSRCKDLKLRLWRDYKQNDQAQTLENRPTDIPEDQWHDFVTTRFTDKWRRVRDRNIKSRSNHTMPHSCGRKSFARKRREIKNVTGKTPCRAEFFIETCKKSDGNFVTKEAKRHADELRILMTQNPSTQVTSNMPASLDDEYSRVFGPERSGRVRCVGRGPTPSKFFKRSTAARTEAENAEVVQMRTKMASLENNVKNLTGILQQLLSTTTSDQAPTWATYANIISSSSSQERGNEFNENQNGNGLNVNGMNEIGMNVNGLNINGSERQSSEWQQWNTNGRNVNGRNNNGFSGNGHGVS
ncbi:PREDICTED: uncharacterized protein LOC104721962 [Camelina sativa]|uniref:Uncharacterized protein LOC104721962 n=1 Tax=Camelina sativa TaxID=90675 RepID=A0ABM0UAK9_CAMSA|nr:PREDICTED: uncharacterized protein LOC104721962 [Camelina sativa]XP_010438341.1 PREDICTED: uncharacterized protein LOC104721962 [Camelina sativa]XP_010438343.1 PREDICTED: uncharacterized protein LOC104721962 [Camelina sativa]